MEQKEKEIIEEKETIYGDSGEITFKGIWSFIRKSLLRMLIYLLAVLVLATAITLGFKYFAKTDYSVSSKIEFTYQEISSGKYPSGAAFNKEDMRAVNFISTALKESGLDEKVINSGNDIAGVRNRLSIEGVMPDEYRNKYNELVAGGLTSAEAYAQLAQMTFYPSQFVISLRDFEALGFKRADAVKFLDGLIAAYSQDFLRKYSKAVEISDEPFSYDSDLYDYLDYCDIYGANYSSINAYLDSMIRKTDFTSTETGKSFSALKSEVAFLQTQLDALKGFIKNNNISTDIDDMKVNIKNQLDQLKKEQARLTEVIDSIKLQLTTYQPSTTTVVGDSGNPVITVTYPQAYYDLQNRLTSYNEQLAQANADFNEKTQIYDSIKDKTQSEVSTSDKAKADSMLAQLRTSSKEFIGQVNLTTADYVKLTINDSSLRTVSPAAYVSSSASFPTLLVYIVAVVAAIAAALIVTWAKSKNAEKKAAEQKHQVGQ